MKERFAFVLTVAIISVSTVTAPKSSAQASDSGAVQVITVSAKKYEFEPSEIRVKKGTTVRLKITALDHAHGFKINPIPEGAAKGSEAGLAFPSPQDCVKIEENQTTTVEFLANKPGTYAFRCCVVCGFHHHAMKGRVIVEP